MKDKSMKLFSFIEIFSFKRGERLIEEDQIFGDIPYISATRNYNGINTYLTPPEKMTHHRNKITLTNSGSVGYCFFHEYEFVASDHVTVIWIKEKSVSLTKNIALYLKPILEAMKYKYSFGREISDKRIKREKILLPINEKEEPDWNYMEQYIDGFYKNIKFNQVNSINKSSLKLNTNGWKEFNLYKELFNIERGTRLIKEDRIEGNVPLVTAGYENQGIAKYISNEEMVIYNLAITIDMFGNCFYRDYDFYCDDNIIVLKPNFRINKYIALFIISLISQEKNKFSYGRQYRLKHIKKHKIKLPTIKVETRDFIKEKEMLLTIDFKFMENYIKSITYGDKL